MTYTGLSIIIRNKQEFDRVKEFLGSENLYLNFAPYMTTTKTAVVVFADFGSCFATGSAGRAEYQEAEGLRLVDFSEFFK